ncbi:hypothetical protein DNHGIG_36820 [Collibacillus ludicampi]|uniref:YCII-related domain-containing protein n=1 Tax=Collibacillus ludicampi TaxID=2771369 RepID=A0AAV4LKK4_9BACL|nr:YciI family protein [Collibacillus ludicampi]GIM48133.1 hypothetical protein DNHGIG_36820 [Collibacillus ludicampi]
MFLLLVKYVKPLEEVEAVLEAHKKWLDTYYQQSKFIVSGRRNPRVGGVLLAHGVTESEVKQMISEDPFVKNQLAEYEIIEFTPTKYDQRFACFVNE